MKMKFNKILEEEYDRKPLREKKEVNYDIPEINKAWNSIDSAIDFLRNVPNEQLRKSNQVIKILWDA